MIWSGDQNSWSRLTESLELDCLHVLRGHLENCIVLVLTGRHEVTVDPSSHWYVNVFSKPHTNLSCDHSQPSIEEESKKDICKLATVTHDHCCSCKFRSPLSYGYDLKYVSYIGRYQNVFASSLPLMKSEISSFSSDSQLPVLPQGQASVVIVVFLVSHLWSQTPAVLRNILVLFFLSSSHQLTQAMLSLPSLPWAFRSLRLSLLPLVCHCDPNDGQ